jgi:predicted transposase/invertase (TIGR01784 family)
MTLSITYAQFSAEIDQKIEQGIEQGQIQGRLSAQQEIARELLKDGMDPETVSRLTKLPFNQLPQLDA